MLLIVSNNYLLMLTNQALYSFKSRNILRRIVTIITILVKENDYLNSALLSKTFFMSFLSNL